MIPGNGERRGPIPGYRPVGSPRNGLPEGASGGYRRMGDPNWDPWNGSHHDPSIVTTEPRRKAPAAASRPRSVKLAEYCEARDAEMTQAEAAEYAGVAVSTAEKYERDWRARSGTGGAP